MRDRQEPANMDEMAIRLGRLEELALATSASALPRRGAKHPGAPDGWIAPECTPAANALMSAMVFLISAAISGLGASSGARSQ